MYLKRLDIQGFKSFPENTKLLFDKGITSIVGPNGCGKSNIADAIRWVLGEQSMKAIRGSKLEDIIFTGTEFRKPLGFSEVTLTIDNFDKTLPIDFSEVTVTRRFFRSGESEYYINKTPCRLKDINNLFLDTGIGRDGYSIIGQGRIDEILSTKSEDRRHIFEEASGIMKFKLRKEEGIKKIELTRQNLIRIEDILSELELQLGPLKEQEETAKKYLALRDKLKEQEICVYIDTIEKLKDKIKKCQKDYSTALEIRDNLLNKSKQASNNSSDKYNLLKALEDKLDISRKEYYSLESEYKNSLSEIDFNNDKLANLKENIERSAKEISYLDEKSLGLQDEIKEKENELVDFNRNYEEIKILLSNKEAKREDILSSLNEVERKLESIKIAHMNKLDILSDKRVQAANINSQIENIKVRKDLINNEISNIGLTIEKDNKVKANLYNQVDRLKKELAEGSSSLELLFKSKRKLEDNLLEKKNKLQTTKSTIQINSSRYKMLNEMEENLEGYNKTVKSFLQACSKIPSLGKGIKGAIGQLISVEEKFELAIEISLGSVVQNIVTQTEEDAKIAIEYLKNNNLGRATFLPISSVKGRILEDRFINEAKKHDGFIGIASELITYDIKYKGIMESLLGRVAIVTDLDSGIAIAKSNKYAFRIITLDGDILATSGAMSGGSKNTYNPGILSRAREINALHEENIKLNTYLEKIENEINIADNHLQNLLLEIQEVQDNLRKKEMDKLKLESQLAHINENIQNNTSKIDMLKEEYHQISREEDESKKELLKYDNEIKEIQNEINKLKEFIDEKQNMQRENMTYVDEILAEITTYKIKLNSFNDNLLHTNREIERLKQDKAELAKSASLKNQEIDKYKEEINSLSAKNKGLERLIKTYQEKMTGKNIDISRVTEERIIIEEELGEISFLIEDINKNIQLTNEELNRLDIGKVKFESELEGIQNRLWDEYELTYTNALEYKKDIGSISHAQREINEYKKQIKDLGYINIAAIEEYKKTKERYEFITAQKKDMEDSVEKLQIIVSEINKHMKQQFLENFNLINKNFNEVFNELFGGGIASLRLTDKENILESGIEIDVQPPGKRLQNMMLLSGGERALTAIALLFSILLLKPVSFCVLDEIEAALDEANVNRFASYIKKFAQKTQFIIITHKKSTMEVSDAIYGVTMQEKGISKVVSMKLNDDSGKEKVG